MRARMINEEMSQHDLDLISQANKVHFIDSYLVDNMVDKAESEEAKEELKRIARYLYHKEEGRDI
jgi:UTP-glucose-1-phosphate uridylyltransferase